MDSTQTRKSMDEFVKVLLQDAIYIPKKVMKNEDVYQETKIMFSVILNENQNLINKYKKFPLQEIIDIYNKIDIERIKLECFCGEPKARLIKEEMIQFAKQLEDILDIPQKYRSNTR